MKKTALDDLVTIGRLKFDRACAEIAKYNEMETRLRASLATLDDQTRQDSEALQSDIALRRALKDGLLMRARNGRAKAQINHELTSVMQQKLAHLNVLQKEFGRWEALKTLREKSLSEGKKR